ncbi:MAG TPA: SpoIIE family protein phosphatase, partial [Actinomycetota bacterium]
PRDQAQHHPQQNILTKVLGVDEDLEVDDLTIDPIQPGDRILLCTDGLSHMVDEDVIERILKGERDPQTAAERLVDAALEAGGEDNVTVLVLDVEEGDPAEASVSSPASAVAEELPTRRWRRALVWLAVLLVVVIAGLIGADVYVSHQWYVGEEAGRVAIYNGIPTKVLWVELSHVEETTELSAARVEQVAYWRSLPDGITADNLQEARGIVDQMRQDVQSIQSPKR